jgi:tetratricopeptide (TPR) repeat protein
LGVLADTERNYEIAIEHYRAALSYNSESALLLTNLGYSHYLAGNFDRAEDLYRKAIGLDATYPRPFANLGLIYARRGDYDDAIVILRKVTERRQAYNDVGYLAYQNGDLDAAAWLLSEAIRISPNYYETAYENLEKVQREVERRGPSVDEVELIGARDQIRLRDDREPVYRRVDAVTLNVRESGSTGAPVVAYLRSNDSVEVLFDNGDWAFVGFGEGPTEKRETGWVRSKFLVANPSAGDAD